MAHWLRKRQAATNPKYGCPPDKLPASQLLRTGIAVLDKPSGPTSHQVSAYVRDILGVARTGHSGTLDPKVTGVLPVALEQSTRLVQSLLSAGKDYVCLMHLHKSVPLAAAQAAFARFTGTIKQLPPVRSAVKRQVRARNVYVLEILDMEGQDVLFRSGVQAGTYIRKLCHDIGKDLGVGAHMSELRRTRAGPYDEAMAVTLQDLVDAMHYHKQGDDGPLRKAILPRESAVRHLPGITVLDSAVDPLCHGQSLKVPGIAAATDDVQADKPVAVFTLKGELILVGGALMDAAAIMKEEKGIAVKAAQVLMAPATYPKIAA